MKYKFQVMVALTYEDKDIELEHSSCCICRIPEDWLPK